MLFLMRAMNFVSVFSSLANHIDVLIHHYKFSLWTLLLPCTSFSGSNLILSKLDLYMFSKHQIPFVQIISFLGILFNN